MFANASLNPVFRDEVQHLKRTRGYYLQSGSKQVAFCVDVGTQEMFS